MKNKDIQIKQDHNTEIENRDMEIGQFNKPEAVKAKPVQLPNPTYWPFFTAMGLLFMGWGLLSLWLVSVAGFIVFIISLIGWINLMRHE